MSEGWVRVVAEVALDEMEALLELVVEGDDLLVLVELGLEVLGLLGLVRLLLEDRLGDGGEGLAEVGAVQDLGEVGEVADVAEVCGLLGEEVFDLLLVLLAGRDSRSSPLTALACRPW